MKGKFSRRGGAETSATPTSDGSRIPDEAAGGVRLAALLPGARFVGCDDLVVRRITDDPDACRRGDVFVAVAGDDGDGHDRAGRAMRRGAAGVVAERMIPTFGTPLCLVPDARHALARIAQALHGDPATRLRVIAITGTAGKTTSAWLTASVLAEGGLHVGVLSDLGCLDGDGGAPADSEYRSPLGLAGWLGRCAATGCSHVIVEVTSAMLAAETLAGVPCDTVVVTNLGRAHLDRHGSARAYRAITGRIVDALDDRGALVVDLDDPRAARLAARRGGGRVVPVGLRRQGTLGAVPLERGLDGQTFLLRHAGDSAVVSVATPVASYVRDSLAAAAVGLRAGLPLSVVARGLEAAGAIPGRLDRICRGQDAHVFADCPTSGRALATTLAGLRRLTRGRLCLLVEEPALRRFGDPRRFHDRAARWCDECLTVPADVLDAEAGSRPLAAYARIDRLLAGLGAGDCVLVVGRPLQGGGDPGDPDPGEPRMPLAVLVDAWMQLAHPAAAPFPGRRAA